METSRIDHVNIRVPEDGVETAVEFYSDVLGLEPEKLQLYREGERTSFAFRISGDTMLHIRPVEDFERPAGKNFDHFCIVVDQDIEEVKQELESAGIEVQKESEPWGATGRAPAVYIEDPFGYSIEFKQGDA